MNKINVSGIILNHAPRTEASKSISSWFKDETIELNFGEYTGRPSANITMHKDYLAKFLENGWTIAAVGTGVEEGKWETISTDVGTEVSSADASSAEGSTSVSSSSNSSRKRNNNNVTTSTVSNSSSSSSTNNNTTTSDNTSKRMSGSSSSSTSSTSSSSSNSSKTSDGDVSTSKTTGSTNSQSNNSSRTDETQTTTSTDTASQTRSTSNASSNNSNSASSNDSESTSSTDSTYWAAYQRIRLKRRRMQPERVLQAMVTSFTDSYNSGRSIENARYDEMISLYAVALSNTETECNDLISGAMNLTPLFNTLSNAVLASLSSSESAAKSIDTYASSGAESDVSGEFADVESRARSHMTDNGTQNEIVWATVVAGIYKQKSDALVKAKNTGRQISASALVSAASIRGTISSALMSAAQAMSDAADKRKMNATEARNAVVKWIVDFVGQKEEVYPELQEISTLTERLGFSVGSAGNVL